MNPYTLGPTARTDLAGIYRFTKKRWGTAQADAYTGKMFARFNLIAQGQARSRLVADAGVEAYRCICEEHYIYWRQLPSGKIGIVTVLHHHMVQADRVRKAFAVSF